MKPPHFALLGLLILLAAFSGAQIAPLPETPDANQSGPAESAEIQATGAGQTPEPTPPPAKPSAGQPAQPGDQTGAESKDAQSAKDAANATSKDRLFFALPNFLTVQNSGHIAPLTAKQKFAINRDVAGDASRFTRNRQVTH